MRDLLAWVRIARGRATHGHRPVEPQGPSATVQRRRRSRRKVGSPSSRRARPDRVPASTPSPPRPRRGAVPWRTWSTRERPGSRPVLGSCRLSRELSSNLSEESAPRRFHAEGGDSVSPGSGIDPGPTASRSISRLDRVISSWYSSPSSPRSPSPCGTTAPPRESRCSWAMCPSW